MLDKPINTMENIYGKTIFVLNSPSAIKNAENNGFHVPSEAWTPMIDLWWEVAKSGKVYPAYASGDLVNDDGSVDFTEDLLQEWTINTQKMLDDKEPIRIKFTHEDSLNSGLANGVKYENGSIYVRIYALDYSIASMVASGSLPGLSMEIETTPWWGTCITAVALLGADFPAVKGLKTPDLVYNSEKTKPVLQLGTGLKKENKKEDFMSDPKNIELELQEFRAQLKTLSEQNASLKATLEEKEKENEKSQEYSMGLEKKIVQLELCQISSEITSRLEKLNIPDVDKESVNVVLMNLTGKTEIKLSEDKSVNFANVVWELLEIIDRHNNVLKNPVMSKANMSAQKGVMYYDPYSDNNDETDKFVREYIKEQKKEGREINYPTAFNELVNNGRMHV